MHIFVSYTTRDIYVNKFSLSIMNDILSRYGNVYIDLIHNNSENKQDRVLDELRKCNFFIFLRSDSIDYSEWACLELNLAKNYEKNIIDLTISADFDFYHLSSKIVNQINRHITISP